MRSPRLGEQVGILDGDVYGHSIPHMLGIHQKPIAVDEMIVPPVRGDLKLMSIGFFLDENAPIMWRGPMLHQALEQFLSDVHWGELDTLLVDMPPGTGDVAMSLGQLLPRAEALVVTTPQPAAQQVAVRAAQMAQKTGMRIVGAVENMSYLVGTGQELFGSGGGQALADEIGVPLLARIPLDPVLREAADDGEPVLEAAPDSEVGAGDRRARRVGRGVARRDDPEAAHRPLARVTSEEARSSARGARARRARGRRAARALRGRRAAREGGPWPLARRLARDARLRPRRRGRRGLVADDGFERWSGDGALGYLVLDEIVALDARRALREHARVVVVERCFPTGVLGHWVRRLAEGGLVAALTATSPRRLPHPEGGPPLTGTNPLAIAIPSSDGRPLVADVSMGAVTHGAVLAGAAPAGGARALRRRAGAQGVRARRRARAPRGRARRPGAGRRARRRPAGARPRARLPRARRRQAPTRRLMSSRSALAVTSRWASAAAYRARRRAGCRRRGASSPRGPAASRSRGAA